MTKLTAVLRQEYDALFETAHVNPESVASVDVVGDHAMNGKDRYLAVADAVGCPWYVVAVIHNLEAGFNFQAHLHNGDPLTARTTHVPKNRPKAGEAPYTWEESAIDALTSHGFDTWDDWAVPGMLFKLEQYNGFGYRNHHPDVLSPYLWSFTNHYKGGKFVADGKFDHSAVSKQCGAVAMLERMIARNQVSLAPAVSGGRVRAMHAGPIEPIVIAHPFPGVALKRHDSGPNVGLVQERLRAHGFQIKVVEGSPFGPQTEAAVRAFQKQHGFKASGRVGSDTWAALFKV
jgi:lysozyme family protein